MADVHEGTLSEVRKNVGLTCRQRNIVERQEGDVGVADAGTIGKSNKYAVVSAKLVGTGGGGSKEMDSAYRI